MPGDSSFPPDGSDHEMVSHYDWRGPDHMLAWARQHDTAEA